mmetsp:Transcript_10553/g.14731  ORF Transcript_10553/g.14731 Transcript_10553/m.14731 type:complete len:304 (-) Transcript_10553:873-1784(-)
MVVYVHHQCPLSPTTKSQQMHAKSRMLLHATQQRPPRLREAKTPPHATSCNAKAAEAKGGPRPPPPLLLLLDGGALLRGLVPGDGALVGEPVQHYVFLQRGLDARPHALLVEVGVPPGLVLHQLQLVLHLQLVDGQLLPLGNVRQDDGGGQPAGDRGPHDLLVLLEVLGRDHLLQLLVALGPLGLHVGHHHGVLLAGLLHHQRLRDLDLHLLDQRLLQRAVAVLGLDVRVLLAHGRLDLLVQLGKGQALADGGGKLVVGFGQRAHLHGRALDGEDGLLVGQVAHGEARGQRHHHVLLLAGAHA